MRTLRRSCPSWPLAERRCLGGVLRTPMRRPQRAVRGASRARRARPAARASRPPRARHAMRRSRPSTRTSSRSRIMPTTRRRRCFCSFCAARARPALPRCRRTASPAAGPALLRPLLSLPRAAIDAYARAAGLEWVDDESNADTSVKRNFIRHDIAPRLAAAFPGYPATLARAAAHQAEAALLHDDLARLDGADAVGVRRRSRADARSGRADDALPARAAPRTESAALVPAPARASRAVGGASCRDARPAHAGAGRCARTARTRRGRNRLLSRPRHRARAGCRAVRRRLAG